MHYQSVAALLFAFAVSLSYSQTHIVTPSSPFNTTWNTINLRTEAQLRVQSSHRNVSVCIVYDLYKLPKWTEYNEENCLFYYNLTSLDAVVHIPLLLFKYQVGVYLAYETGTKDVDNTTITLTLTGDTCPDGFFWDGTHPECQKSVPITNVHQNFTGDFTPGSTLFWTYMAPPSLGWLNFTMKGLSGEAISAEELEIKARYAGGTVQSHDALDNGGILSIPSPRQGLWVFSVRLAGGAQPGKGLFELSEFQCGDISAGPGCMTHVLPGLIDNMNYTISGGEWIYMRLVVDKENPILRVSVTTTNASNIPYLYAGNGQIPHLVTSAGSDAAPMVVSDISNCNADYCSVVRSIFRNSTLNPGPTETEIWYIGIYSTVPGEVNFGLWWNNTCVPNCDDDNHGECEDSGRCQCEIDFEGINCALSKGLGPQYIVLIIIASLVVASAIIGFVAWAYMRRKRANYEIVS